MNLYHLRYFVTLAHIEHYTKAAELLSITQPSLSHAISSLEKELGVKLFEKEGRNIVLTKCGKAFLEDIEKSLDLIDSSIDNLQMTGRGGGHIDIALLRTLSTNLIPKFVRGFLDSNPDSKVEFRFHNDTGMSMDMLEGLKSKKYDVAFCSKQPNEPTIDFIPIAKQELVVVVPPDHPLAVLDRIDLRETAGYPMVYFSKRGGLRTVVDGLYEKCRIKPNIAYEIDEDQTVAGLVATGFGIAVVPNMPILNLMNLKVIHIGSPIWERFFYMATLKNSYRAPVIEDFKNYVMDHAEL